MCTLAFYVIKRLGRSTSNSAQNGPGMKVESMPSEEASPSPAGGFTKADLSSALVRLRELEVKVDVLQSKHNKMPYEKEEMLNAAVYRVDALEAELITTKKVIVIILHLKPCSIHHAWKISFYFYFTESRIF